MGLPAGSSVVITTRLLPPLVIDLSGGTQPLPTVATGISAGLFLKLMAPTVTVNLANQQLTSFSPAGQATANYWPVLKWGLIGAAAVLVFWVGRKLL